MATVDRVRVACLSASVFLACACGGSVDDNDGSEASTAEDTAVIEINGRTFLRHDQWSAEDLERILYEGRPELDSTNPAVLAAQLRAHTMRDGQYYIELEPNLELAQRIIDGPTAEATPAQEPELEGRKIFGTDTRNLSGASSALAFNSSRGSGVKIAKHALYTAAHVVYETWYTPNGWYCEDGTWSNPCTLPKWGFGLNGTAASTWTTNTCYGITITNAFIGITSSSSTWDFARWDYAAVNTTNCNDANTGYFGTSPVSDQQLLALTGHNLGYAERATCPTGSQGTDSDCPGTGSWPGSTWQLIGAPGSEPFIGARLWHGSASDLAPGDANPANTIKTTIDVTHGNSGGPLYDSNGNYVVGVAHGSTSSGTSVNVFNRWNTEVHNFMHTYAPFPQP